MMLALYGLALVSLLEISLWTKPIWRARRPFAIPLIIGLAVLSGVLVGFHPSIWTVLIVLLSIYRIVNLLRVLEGRVHEYNLRFTGRKTSALLIGSQLIIIGITGVDYIYSLSGAEWLVVLGLSQTLCALVLAITTTRHLRTTKLISSSRALADRDLPTLTVAIPARNESSDLEACLQSLVKSTYPKLEIIVLDDCSQLKRTPEIIRGFAHDGVRFIAGKSAPEGWLSKNYAYQQLLEAASGEIILFCGVDTRFNEGSLRGLVINLITKNKDMLSVIPKNIRQSSMWPGLLSIQPNRYTWELSLPRKLFKRPPVLSTCWLIKRELLRKNGGFEGVKQSIIPESYFAHKTASNTDGYTFMQSNADIGLISAKSLYEQKSTALRTRYPQLHKRPEVACLFSALELLIVFGPFSFILIGLATQNWLLFYVSLLNVILLSYFYVRIVNLTYRHYMLRGLWLLPFAVIYDVCLLNYSMWRYEFEEVIWKDNNICIPTMQVIPKLPPL